MNLFTGASALTGVLKGATGFVQALKQPRVSGAQFAALLNQQIDMHRGHALSPQAQRDAQAAALASKFITLRDADGDLRLRADESGLDAARFAVIDADKDGYLSAQELRAYAAAQYHEAAQVLK